MNGETNNLPIQPPDHTPAHTPIPALSNGSAPVRKAHHINTLATPTPPASAPSLMLWPAEEERKAAVNLSELIAMLRRRWKIMAGTFLAVLAASLLYIILSPRVYQATATLQAMPASESSPADEIPALAGMMASSQTRSLQTQAALLKHDLMKERAARRLPPSERAAVKKSSSMIVEPLAETDLITVSALTRSPALSVNLANAICDEYIGDSQQKNRRTTKSAKEYVEKQLKSVQVRLETAQNSLKQYKNRHGIFDLPQESQVLITQASQIEAGWLQAKADKQAAVAQLAKLRSIMTGMAPSRTVPTGIVRRPAVESMKLELMRLELDRITKLREYLPQSPEVQLIDQQIAGVRQRLRTEAQTEIEGWRTEANPVQAQLAQEVVRLQGQVWALEGQGHALRNSWLLAKKQLSQLPEREYRLAQMSRDLAAQQRTYEMLNDKLQTLRISEMARVANAEIVFPAQLSEVVRVRPQTVRVLVMAIIGGLMLAVGLAALADQLDDRIHTEQDARKICQLPVLADIPLIREADHRSLYEQSLAHPSSNNGAVDEPSALLATYQMLRANIEFSGIDEPIHAIVLTSSLPDEGKSMSAVNLAVAAALSGEQVILIDCDLRRPSLHRLCGLPNEVGFSNVVTGSHSLAEALQDTAIPGLRVLTGGTIPPNAFKLLRSKAASACFQQAIEQADFVVIDTPPVLAMADAQVVASLADAVVMVISAKDTRRAEVIRTRDLLAQTGTDLIGTVLNKVTGVVGGYSAYNYYGNYGKLPQPTKQLLSSKQLFKK
jgi:succinoglycan biosynthesis transport protein ExoP